MRLVVVAVGRVRAGPERDVFEHYAQRITFPFEIKEVEEKRRLSGGALKAREGDLLRAQVPAGARVVALDERGKAFTSAEFARTLGAWRDDGVGDVAFLIGGADGLDGTVTKGADIILGLGPMTWPHLLVRGMLAEQIYRAQCILSGHPYHRE